MSVHMSNEPLYITRILSMHSPRAKSKAPRTWRTVWLTVFKFITNRANYFKLNLLINDSAIDNAKNSAQL